MISALEPIANRLKAARRQKKLSQRALSRLVEMPQSHLSRIENGLVDPQTTSLIELARALDLEVMLVPRILVPTIEGMTRHKAGHPGPAYQLESNMEKSGHGNADGSGHG